MGLTSPRDPNSTTVQARDNGKPRELDFDRFVAGSGHSLSAFLRSIGELWQRRALVPVLASRDLKGSYEMNIVGFAWWLLEPLSMTAVYYVLFNILRGGRNDPTRILGILVALLAFKWFTQSLIGAMGIIRSNASLITDVYLPRALLPITQIFIGAAHFGVGLVIVPVACALLWGEPILDAQHQSIATVSLGPSLLWLPFVVVTQFVFMLGLAYLFAVWGLHYRNLPALTGNILRLWFYLSPALYDLSFLKGTLRTLMLFNPMTGLFQGYRGAILTHQAPDWTLAYTFGFGLVVTLLGGWYFTSREQHFGKVL